MPLSVEQFRQLPEVVVASNMDKNILELLESEAMTQKELAAELRRKEQFVNRRLNVLVKSGKLQRRKLSVDGERPKFYYALPGS